MTRQLTLFMARCTVIASGVTAVTNLTESLVAPQVCLSTFALVAGVLAMNLRHEFRFRAGEWRIERRPATPDQDELALWFVTLMEPEIIGDEGDDEEPLVLKKIAIKNNRSISFMIPDELLDDHLLWEYFQVSDRRGLDGKYFVSQETRNGLVAIKSLMSSLHRQCCCSRQ